MRISDWSSDVCSSDLLKSTFSDGLRRTTVSLNRKGVLICSRDAVAFGNIFCRLAHVDFEDGIGQRLDHRVEHRHRAHLGPPARGRHDMRRVDHALLPDTQHKLRFATCEHLSARDNYLPY